MTDGSESTRTALSLSVVIPVHDEENSLHQLFERLSRVLDELDEPAEVILVDDGSRDRGYELMVGLHARDTRFKVVRLSRNFGHQMAITAGLDLAIGDAVVIMDADLQHPPETIVDLIAKWRDGFDIVYGIRHERTGEPWLKRMTARVFYRLLGSLSDAQMTAHAGDFRLVDRAALEAFRSLRESNRYVRGMFSWIGFRQVGVPYRGVERHAGTTKYSFTRMLKLGVDGILSFSTTPLRFVLHIGMLVSLISLALFVYALTSKLTGGAALPGWASLLAVTAFLGGIQLLTLGTVGLYVGRIYEEVKQRPLYVVRETCGIEASESLGRNAVLMSPGRCPPGETR
jgi:glycosyltransferase involved in cell wall biosynthesis